MFLLRRKGTFIKCTIDTYSRILCSRKNKPKLLLICIYRSVSIDKFQIYDKSKITYILFLKTKTYNITHWMYKKICSHINAQYSMVLGGR